LFFAGGASSVRGFATNQLGPRVLTVSPERLSLIGCTPGNYGTPGCNPDTTVAGSRPGESVTLGDEDFKPQPLGGTSIVEASIEYRMAIGMRRMLWASAFIDGAVVGSNVVSGLSTLRNLVKGSFAITPGVGIRYKSPVGPIRVDVGLNPGRAESLQVITEGLVDGRQRVISLNRTRRYQPAATLLDRFQLHLSIGQPW
jgi:outer membrane protein assembly factor BamA